MLLVACATAQAQVHTVKYPTLPAATDFQAASATCPVRCKWDGERLRVEHMVKHGKMVAWVPSQTPGAHVNKVFHKCYHDAVTAECKCGCAQWDGDCDVGGRQCPTGCGHEASEFAGNLAENDNLKCYYGSDELPDSHCYAPDRNGACAVDCPATVACPTPAPTTSPTPFPTKYPTQNPTLWQPTCGPGKPSICSNSCCHEGRFTPSRFGDLQKAVRHWCKDEASATSKYGPIGLWNTRRMTSLANLFKYVVKPDSTWKTCNLPIGTWDTSNVKSMSYTFSGMGLFNQDIGDWDVGSVTNFKGMFIGARTFDQDIGRWDVSKATDMSSMFQYTEGLKADASGKPIPGTINGKKCTLIPGTTKCKLIPGTNSREWVPTPGHGFNNGGSSSINNWDVSRVKNMYRMFGNAWAFNQPINNWDMSSVTDTFEMFHNAKMFNQPLDKWNMSNVRTVRNMFTVPWTGPFMRFNQDLSSWDLKSVGLGNVNGCCHQVYDLFSRGYPNAMITSNLPNCPPNPARAAARANHWFDYSVEYSREMFEDPQTRKDWYHNKLASPDPGRMIPPSCDPGACDTPEIRSKLWDTPACYIP